MSVKKEVSCCMHGIDPRAFATERLLAPDPLPYISRKALKRVKAWLPVPTECNYCRHTVILINNSKIYNGREYGDWPFAYRCTGCHAYVGLHPSTDLPLGTLANSELRSMRNRSKKAFFDAMRHYGVSDRTVAYKWLARLMDIEYHECHFGWFSVAQCRHAETVILAASADPALAMGAPAVAKQTAVPAKHERLSLGDRLRSLTRGFIGGD